MHRETDYFFTLALTGHGCFRTYILRLGNAQDDRCKYCGEVDTLRHTLFDSQRWQRHQEEANIALGTALTAENMAGTMISSNRSWQIVHDMIKKIIQTKDKEARERKARDNNDRDNEDNEDENSDK